MNKPLEQMSLVIKNVGIFSSVKHSAMDSTVSKQNHSCEQLTEIICLIML